MTRPLVLVDGSSYLYRAYHALPSLSNAAGEPTGVLHGVLSMLHKLLDQYAPEQVAVVFDAPGKTFRNELYADYKATRTEMPDELRVQIEPLIDAIDALGLPVVRLAGVEADDVIGTIATAASREGRMTIISTGDKDMAQVVDEHVCLVNTMFDTTLDAAGVEAKFGVGPDRIVDFLALVGDTSDNIPGVAGVGPKTAAKWLRQYGNLDGVIAHAAEISGKVGEQLRATLPDLPLFKELVTIDCNVDLPPAALALERREPDKARLKKLYEHFELRALTRRLFQTPEAPDAAPAPAARLESRYELVSTQADLDRWLARIDAADLVALETETTSASYVDAAIVGIALAVAPGDAVYIPLAHRHPGGPEQLDRTLVLERMRSWLETPERAKLGQQMKFHAHVFRNHGITLAGIAHDSTLESYVLNSTATRHDTPSVAGKYLGLEPPSYDTIAGKGAKQLPFDELAIEPAGAYAAEIADLTLRIHRTLWPQLQREPGLATLYLEIECPVLEVLRAMEERGVMVDATLLNQHSRELAASMAAAEEAAYAAAGTPFNLGSPKQLQEILYERLGLPVLGKTPKGQPSTAESVLQDLAASYELPQRILEYRALAKLKSTYTDRLPREINARTGRIHTSYHQAVAATGRLSSSDPNLQNIPIRTLEGRKIRQAFVAAPGYRLIAADYSQIELRIMAHLSADPGLREAFETDRDIHRATAAEVFGLALDEVTHDQRRSAKVINFGLIYGMSPFGLARQLGIDRAEARRYVELYFERYPGVRRYMEQTRQLARERGYVETVFGRRLYLPEINSRNAQRRQYAERSAINAPMQGTAADIIKRAMIGVSGWLATDGIDGGLIMQVHDELVLEVAADSAAPVALRVAAIMESAAELTVALKVDTGIGTNWDEAH
jgi:DNA polymerase I